MLSVVYVEVRAESSVVIVSSLIANCSLRLSIVLLTTLLYVLNVHLCQLYPCADTFNVRVSSGDSRGILRCPLGFPEDILRISHDV